MKTLSIDLRKRILEAYDAGEGTRQEVADRYKVSQAMVKKLLSQRKRLGTIEPLAHKRGRKKLFNEQEILCLREIVTKKPDITLGEIQAQLNKPCHIVTIHRALQRLGASYKKNH